MAESIFRKESMEQAASPEQLNDYIKVSNPGIWLALGAIIVLAAAAGIWAVTAAIPTRVATQALLTAPGRYVCYLPVEQAADLEAGTLVQVRGAGGRVTSVGKTPLSRGDAARILPDEYTAYALGLSDWNIRVDMVLDAQDEGSPADALEPMPDVGSLSPVTIITSVVRPISFLFN
jgi:hypothetical protein